MVNVLFVSMIEHFVSFSVMNGCFKNS